MAGNLIGTVSITPALPEVGESVQIVALDPNGIPLDQRPEVRVTIDGILGAARYLQFGSAGQRLLRVRATAAGEPDDVADARVLVHGPGLTFRPTASVAEARRVPILQLRQSQTNPYEVLLSVGEPTTSGHSGVAALPIVLRSNSILSVKDAQKLVGSRTPRGPLARALASEARGSVVVASRRVVGPAGAGKRKVSSFVVSLGKVDVKEMAFGAGVATPPVYEWDFGDGSKKTTNTPEVAHDYFAAIDHATGTSNFDVRCKVVHDDVEITRTLTVHSAYKACRERGYVVPHVVAETFLARLWGFYTWSLEVHNPEPQDITIDRYAFGPLGTTGTQAALASTKVQLSVPVRVPARGSVALHGSTAIGQVVTQDAAGLSVTYGGSASDGTPVRFTAVFEATLADQGGADNGPSTPFEWQRAWPWDEVELAAREELQRLSELEERPTFDPGDLQVDRGSGTIALAFQGLRTGTAAGAMRRAADAVGRAAAAVRHKVRLGDVQFKESAVPRVPKASKSVLSQLEAVAPGARRLALDAGFRLRDNTGFVALKADAPPTPGPVGEGEICDPDNLTDAQLEEAAEAQLVCQATTEQIDVLMPARFMNARMGDIILSPGGTGLVGMLLRQVDPSQRFSHSGMMTRNYDEVTHSTASEDCLLETVGTDGFDPKALKYMWPGVVRQSVEAAVNGEPYVHPETGKTYSISSFSAHAVGVTHNGRFEVVYPLVVKPDPLEETVTIRSALHGAATLARSQGGTPGTTSKSHYRLYCYTDPTIGQTTSAPTSAGWASGTYPSVCSSFVWMMLKAKGLHLETDTTFVMPTDLEPGEAEEGAMANPNTPDGLYTYTATERLVAAQWLYDTVYYQAYDIAGWAGEILTDAADDTATQIVNTFANDGADDTDSEAWQDTRDANAVSPEDILWWDSPTFKGYYGYSEPMIYREPRVESYTVSRWKKVLAWGNISGTVRYQGSPVSGALVQLYEGMSTFTAANGTYTLSHVALGSYICSASKVIGGVLASAQQSFTLNAETMTLDLDLQPPPERYRLAQVSFDFWGKDEEGWLESNEYTDPGAEYREAELGPDLVSNSFTRTYSWGGELRAEYRFTFDLLADNSIKVTVHCKLFEGTSEDTHDLDGEDSLSFNVPMGETKAAQLDVTNTQEGDDDRAELTITVKNAQNSN